MYFKKKQVVFTVNEKEILFDEKPRITTPNNILRKDAASINSYSKNIMKKSGNFSNKILIEPYVPDLGTIVGSSVQRLGFFAKKLRNWMINFVFPEKITWSVKINHKGKMIILAECLSENESSYLLEKISSLWSRPIQNT